MVSSASSAGYMASRTWRAHRPAKNTGAGTASGKDLLSSGAASVEEVARQSGFGASETMRRLFRNAFGVSPTVYRARFRTTGVSA
ncbi:helix-turn-helix domain-containing protein [Streptomyces sp. NPDC004783]|uniref:helix-turn-helix domain-containing protein n=1 Tax=Streptomyces sp. NPDC004783 TaxID=3154459 RepID=UPI0033B71BD3